MNKDQLFAIELSHAEQDLKECKDALVRAHCEVKWARERVATIKAAREVNRVRETAANDQKFAERCMQLLLESDNQAHRITLQSGLMILYRDIRRQMGIE